MKITVETTVNAPLNRVWQAWNDPDAITQWNAASDDWHTPRAEVDLRPGGSFTARMESKDGSEGFDFVGRYTKVEPQKLIEYRMDDGREVTVEFVEQGNKALVRETFDAESTRRKCSARAGRRSWTTSVPIVRPGECKEDRQKSRGWFYCRGKERAEGARR